MSGEHDPLRRHPDAQDLGDGIGDLQLEARLGAILAGEGQRIRVGADAKPPSLPDVAEGGGVHAGSESARQDQRDACGGDRPALTRGHLSSAFEMETT